jgi:hypothetical protein
MKLTPTFINNFCCVDDAVPIVPGTMIKKYVDVGARSDTVETAIRLAAGIVFNSLPLVLWLTK